MPWSHEEEENSKQEFYKYKYHPHGDKSQELREAPSALNEVIVPNVTLPKVRFSLSDCIRPFVFLIGEGSRSLHVLLSPRICMTDSTSTERTYKWFGERLVLL